MASSSVTYTSGTNNFDITFGYLRDTHVIVQVGESQYDINDDYFTIDTTSTPKVVLNTDVSNGTTVKILRKSLGKNNDQGFLVDFVDGSVLTEKQQDEAYQHNYYINQESKEGNLSVGTPVLDTDAANKAYVDSIVANAALDTLTGDVVINEDLSVSGTTDLTGDVTIDGITQLNSKLGVNGAADSGGYELKVTGDALTTGNARISGKLGVNRDPDSTYTVAIDGDLIIQDTGDNFPAAVFTGSSGAAVQLNDSSSNGSVFNLSSNVPGASGTEVGQFGVGYIDKDEATRTAVNVTNVSVSGNLATITTDAAHDLVQHEYVILSGFSGSNATTYNATHVVAEVTSTTVFKVYIGVTVGSYSGATATKRKTYTTFSVTRKDTGTGTSTVAYSQFQIYVLPQATSEPTYLPSYALWVDTTNGDNIVKCKLPS